MPATEIVIVIGKAAAKGSVSEILSSRVESEVDDWHQ